MVENKKSKKPLYIFLHLPKNGGTSFVSNFRKKSNDDEVISSKKVKNLSEKEKQKAKLITGHEAYYGIHKYFPNREARYIVFLRDPAERRTSQYNHDIARLQEKKKHKKLPPFKKWYKLQIKDEQTFLLNKKYKGIPGRKAPNFTNNFISKFKVGNSKFLKFIGYRILRIYDIFRKSERNKQKELENAKSLLNNCWFVSITKNLDKDIPKLFKEMNIKLGKNEIQRYRTSQEKGKTTDKKRLEFTKSFALDNETRQRIYKDNPYDVEIYEYAKELVKR